MGSFPPGRNAGNSCAGQGQVLAEAERNLGPANVNQVMAGGLPLGGGGLGGANVHTDIDLAAVGVDDFAVAVLGQGDGQGGFAHRSGADDSDEGEWGRHIAAGVVLRPGDGKGPGHAQKSVRIQAGAAHQCAVDAGDPGEVGGVAGVDAAAVEQRRGGGYVRTQGRRQWWGRIAPPIIRSAISGVAARPVPIAHTGS